jgi:UDP-N-acetylmuramyl tripeptide synthase
MAKFLYRGEFPQGGDGRRQTYEFMGHLFCAEEPTEIITSDGVSDEDDNAVVDMLRGLPAMFEEVT